MRASMVASLILVGACANADSPGASYAELAELVGASLVTPDHGGEVGALADAAQLVHGTMPAGFHDEDGWAIGEHMGLRYIYLPMCLTAQGVHVACGPASAAQSAYVLASWSGALELPGITARVQRQGLWRWDGFETGAALVTGTSSLTQDAIVGDAHYRITGEVEHDILVHMQDGQIMNGAQTLALTGTRAGEAFSTTAEVTIRGTVAHVSFDGSEPFEIALAPGPLL